MDFDKYIESLNITNLKKAVVLLNKVARKEYIISVKDKTHGDQILTIIYLVAVYLPR